MIVLGPDWWDLDNSDLYAPSFFILFLLAEDGKDLDASLGFGVENGGLLNHFNGFPISMGASLHFLYHDITFVVSEPSHQLRISATNPRPLSAAVGNCCFWSSVMGFLSILVILALGVGDDTWLGRYPHLSSIIYRGPSQSLFSTGGKWTILDIERKCSHKERPCFLCSGQAQSARSQAFQEFSCFPLSKLPASKDRLQHFRSYQLESNVCHSDGKNL